MYQGGRKAVQSTSPAGGWTPGLGYRGVVKIFDHGSIRTGKHSAFLPFEIRQAEVIFPKVLEITFRLYKARHKAVSTGKDFWAEFQELEAEEERPKPVENRRLTTGNRPRHSDGKWRRRCQDKEAAHAYYHLQADRGDRTPDQDPRGVLQGLRREHRQTLKRMHGPI